MGKYIPPVPLPLRTYAERNINDGRFRLIRPFGDRSACFYYNGKLVCPPHTGEDYGNFDDGGNVLAQHAGRIAFIGWTGDKTAEHPKGMAGYTVIVDLGGGYRQVACHMIDGSCPYRVGDRVEPGDVIGKVGTTGASTGAHLHDELTKDGRSIDPAPYLRAGRLPIEEDEMKLSDFLPVEEDWTTGSGPGLSDSADGPAKGEFWTEGPEQGGPKFFNSPYEFHSTGESRDGNWRIGVAKGIAEILCVHRLNLRDPRNRTPRTGYGFPAFPDAAAIRRAAADAVRDKGVAALNAAAKEQGA